MANAFCSGRTCRTISSSPVQRPEWHVAPDDDKNAAVATRKRVFDWVATERLPVVGFHMPFPSLGFVERAGASYRWGRLPSDNAREERSNIFAPQHLSGPDGLAKLWATIQAA